MNSAALGVNERKTSGPKGLWMHWSAAGHGRRWSSVRLRGEVNRLACNVTDYDTLRNHFWVVRPYWWTFQKQFLLVPFPKGIVNRTRLISVRQHSYLQDRQENKLGTHCLHPPILIHISLQLNIISVRSRLLHVCHVHYLYYDPLFFSSPPDCIN